MSYGALSKNAIMALNRGAKIGGFAHNTGEGGLSPYHLEPGGSLIWQVGTGYFSCRDRTGLFSAEEFVKRATLPNVVMIELKLSQGAKPGHGGILPAAKLTPEICAIRGVEPGHDVISPPAHSSFSTPTGLLEFIKKLRDLSGGKPTGFKLCVGKRREFLAIVKAMLETGIMPDFITIDGGEGGTGAAPARVLRLSRHATQRRPVVRPQRAGGREPPKPHPPHRRRQGQHGLSDRDQGRPRRRHVQRRARDDVRPGMHPGAPLQLQREGPEEFRNVLDDEDMSTPQEKALGAIIRRKYNTDFYILTNSQSRPGHSTRWRTRRTLT